MMSKWIAIEVLVGPCMKIVFLINDHNNHENDIINDYSKDK